MIKKFLVSCTLLASVLMLGFVSGCEGGGGGGDTSVVGTWELSNSGGTWYILFASDGSWKISDMADGTHQRVYGNYTVSGKNVSGSMTNPRVGTGAIAATIDGKNISLDFIEHWHTPYKTVHYTGSKL